jgi:hypothetical protein
MKSKQILECDLYNAVHFYVTNDPLLFVNNLSQTKAMWPEYTQQDVWTLN